MSGSQTTIALTGSPAAGRTVTLEMNGYPPVTYTLNGSDTFALAALQHVRSVRRVFGVGPQIATRS